jgi:hypothetical protein
MTSYEMKLKDPRWHATSNRIKERDNYKCICGGTKNLQVHHKKYPKDKDPWECEDVDLITLCEKHHNLYHSAKNLHFNEDEVNKIFATKERIKNRDCDWDELSEDQFGEDKLDKLEKDTKNREKQVNEIVKSLMRMLNPTFPPKNDDPID